MEPLMSKTALHRPYLNARVLIVFAAGTNMFLRKVRERKSLRRVSSSVKKSPII